MTDIRKQPPAAAFIIILLLLVLAGCNSNTSVSEYFELHGLEYPSDVSGISLLGMQYAGVERDELQESGAREFVEEGIVFSKIYLHKENVSAIVPGSDAIAASKPVLFRGEEGEVGLMIRVTAYGSEGESAWNNVKVRWLGKDKKLWKAVNFAYFNRDDFYRWQFGGWVYE